jgi:hypothetical protein
LNLCRAWPDQSITGGLQFPDPVQRRLAFIQLGGVVRFVVLISHPECPSKTASVGGHLRPLETSRRALGKM